ncbi:MAG: hypothetical protein M9942_04710, partial [Microthrixaceae bacterium]|nr:hypothetical protein [Microthrixaceae bacterium]
MLTVNDAPPAPPIAASSAPSGEQFFAGTIDAVPTLAVDAVSDTTLAPGQSSVQYHFSVASNAIDTNEGSGDIATWSGTSTTLPSGQITAAELEDGHTYHWRVWADDGFQATSSQLFSFTFDRRLGTGGPSPMVYRSPLTVNAATGNMVFGWSSRQVTTLGGGAGVSLSYNSLLNSGAALLEATPGLPPGWRGSWGELPVTSLEFTDDGSAVIRMTDGGRESFRWNDADDRWEPVEDNNYSLFTEVGSGYQWQTTGGWTVEFDSSGAIDSASNNLADDTSPTALEYTYDTGSPKKLTSVTDPVTGRTIEFHYGGGSCQTSAPTGLSVAPSGLLCKIVHMDDSVTAFWYTTSNGVHQIARIVEDGNGNLGTGTDDQAVWDLGWNSGHQIESIRDPYTNRLITAGVFSDTDPGHTTDITYDSPEGRVTSIRGPKPDTTHPRPQTNLGYATGSTTVTDANRSEPNGFTTRYTLDDRGRATKFEDRRLRTTHTRWEDETTDRVLWTDTESLDESDSTVWMRTGTVYDDRGRPVQQWGPANRTEFGATSETTGTASGGSSTPLATTVYDGNLTGFSAQYWDNEDLQGAPVGHGAITDTYQHGTGTPHSELPSSDGWSMRATGSVKFSSVGTYNLRAVGWGPTSLLAHESYDNQLDEADPGGASTVTAEVEVVVSADMVDKWYPIVIETADAATDSGGTGGFKLEWQPPAGSWTATPAANVRPEFGLSTRTETRVSATHSDVVEVSYDEAGTATVDETYLGIPRSTTVDPGGLDLTTSQTFEEVDPNKYLRRKSRTLPSGSDSTVTYDHYSPTEGPIAAVCGVSAGTDQLGLPKRTTQADPDGVGGEDPIVREYVYDDAGRQVGYRASADLGSEPWTCTTYDDAGRADEISYPAWGGQPARTVSYSYAVSGDPRVTSVSDAAGTITTTTDWAGRPTSYEDVWGFTTTTTYDNLGRVASKSNPGGTLAYTYDNDDQVTEVTLNGEVIAEPTYDDLSRMESVYYPDGAGNAGNGTSGVFTFDDKARAKSMSWLDSSPAAMTSDVVTARDLTNRITDQSTDGHDPRPGNPNYIYDRGGRLTEAYGFAEAPSSTAATHHYEYDYTSAGTGVATAAGKNGNRVSKTVDSGTPVTYDYDHADRLTATSDTAAAAVNTAGGTLAYDDHGNTSILDGEHHVYDIADRHIATEPATTGSSPGDAVLVVGDDTSLTGLDSAIKSRLEGDGWTVTVEEDDDVDAATDDGADLIFVAESSDTTPMNEAPLAASTVPLISAEVFAFDELGMTGSTGWVDHGPQASQTQIDVTAAGAAHDLGAGNSAGAVTILTAADEIGWGKPAGSATVAATIHGDSSKATVFGYDTNDTMSTGTAPARRVGLWMYRVSDNLINTDGWDFFDAAVNWAANITGGSTGSTNIMWSYPNLQGSIAAQADDTGTQTSGTHIYTPDGVPTAGGLPDTRPGEMDDTWLGSHQRPLEHATGLQPVIEMGARQYHPILA